MNLSIDNIPIFDVYCSYIDIPAGVALSQTDAIGINPRVRQVALSGVFPEPSDYIQDKFPGIHTLTLDQCRQVASLNLWDFLKYDDCVHLYEDLIGTCLDSYIDFLIIDAAPASFCYCKERMGENFSHSITTYLYHIGTQIQELVLQALDKNRKPLQVFIALPTAQQIDNVPLSIPQSDLIEAYVKGFPKLVFSETPRDLVVMHNSGFTGGDEMAADFKTLYPKAKATSKIFINSEQLWHFKDHDKKLR